MKIAQLICLVSVLAPCSVHAQNLVVNPSFEEYSSCPIGFGMVDNATGWQAMLGSPDYMHTCANGLSYNGVPYFSVAFQYPATGLGYTGLLTYGGFGPDQLINIREYIKGTLTQPLRIGTRYYVSFMASSMDRAPFATNNLGIKFVNYPTANFPITNSAHVNSNVVITDTVNWTLVTGSFVADAMYMHFLIGNHFTDLLTTITGVLPESNTSQAYYIIDDVCVSYYAADCDVGTSIQQSSHQDMVSISPNPFDQRISITSVPDSRSEIVIYDLASRIIRREVFWGSTTLDTGDLDQGVYLYLLQCGSEIIAQGKLIKE